MKNTKKIMAAVFAAVVLCLFTGCGTNPLSGKTFKGKMEYGSLLGYEITLKFRNSEVVVTQKSTILGFSKDIDPYTSPYSVEGNEVTFKQNKDDEVGTTFIFELNKKNLDLYIGEIKWASLEQK